MHSRKRYYRRLWREQERIKPWNVTSQIQSSSVHLSTMAQYVIAHLRSARPWLWPLYLFKITRPLARGHTHAHQISHTLMIRYLFWISITSQPLKKYVLYSMKVIRTYYIHHVVIFIWPVSVSYVTLPPFINPLPWPHGIECLSYANFRILSVVVGYLVTSCLLFYEYCDFGHSSFVAFYFFAYYKLGKYEILDAATV